MSMRQLTHTPADEATIRLLRELLPRFYWARDVEARGSLDALVASLAAEYEALRLDVADLYDDLFIETCAPELIPYIGEGIGVGGLGGVAAPIVGDRAWVGRVLGFRRRKGGLATVARAAGAATGWAVYAQEGGSVTAHTQSVLYPDPGRGRLVDVSRTPSGADPDAPWSQVTRRVSVVGRPVSAGMPPEQQPAPRSGYPAPLTVEVAIWRLQAFPVERRAPAASDRTGHAFRFHPAGIDCQLFAAPRSPRDEHAAPRRDELPLPLTIPALADAFAAAKSARDAPVAVWRIGPHGRSEPIPPSALAVADLSGWRAGAHPGAEAIVDPLCGRLLFTGAPPANVQVSYAYGFSGALGGGPYGHASSYEVLGSHTRVLHVTRTARGGGQASYASIEAALAAAAEPAAGDDCLVLVDDSSTYVAPAGGWRVELPHGRSLRIASVPEVAPVLEGSFDVALEAGTRLELSGLLVLGGLAVAGSGEVAIEHSTLAPQDAASVTVAERSGAALSLSFAIAGRIDAGPHARVSARSSILDGRGHDAVGSEERPVGELDVRQVTVLGATAARTIVAEDSIFTGRVVSAVPESGLIRTSVVPAGSSAGATVGSPSVPDAEAQRPWFSSTRWGDAAYAQLDLRCPRAIATGASRGGELGAFYWLHQPTRFARLPIVLHEMLPAGVAASVDYRN